MAETYPINIWINEERFDRLRIAGLADMAKEVLAGMKVLSVPTTEKQRDEILTLFPMAKYDSATTRSIELIPRDVKDQIFDLVIRKKSMEVIAEFLQEHMKSRA